jgi:hypothetical protein
LSGSKVLCVVAKVPNVYLCEDQNQFPNTALATGVVIPDIGPPSRPKKVRATVMKRPTEVRTAAMNEDHPPCPKCKSNAQVRSNGYDEGRLKFKCMRHKKKFYFSVRG